MVSDGFANSERLQIDPVSKDIRLKPYEIEIYRVEHNKQDRYNNCHCGMLMGHCCNQH